MGPLIFLYEMAMTCFYNIQLDFTDLNNTLVDDARYGFRQSHGMGLSNQHSNYVH